jgi:aspartokinase
MGYPIAVQINQSRLYAKGVDLRQGLRTLREETIHAVVSVDGMTYLLDDNNLNLAHLALSRAFTGLKLETTCDKAALITIVGLDADYLDLLHEQMPAIVGEPQAEILVTTGASGQANLTVLLPMDTLDSSIEKIHNLLREQSK